MPEQSTRPPPPTPTKGDPEWWRKKFSGLTGLGLSDEERAAHRAEAECRKCEKNRDYLMNYSPIVRFMLENITKLNGKMDDSNIRCMPCENFQSGGFSPEYGVLLCQNRLRDRGHTEDTLAHELVHVYDHLRFRVDWEELKHHACSEIRASSLSGECRWTREAFTRGVFDFTKQHQACVKRRAILSVQNNPKCKDEAEATKIVNQVFDSCFADTRPFSEIYR
ncbi:peptidase M76 family-domain-containing protein [Tuber borchii]|uniref:Mitochondrial inner membrane protease ATP23 n=1 Tax=Tuber borchii TaxID=42251 RepID=A0A2T6ZPB0_TUBBO|nr:peptidase M76 family-domain-containing protein [Tuber borchii]